MTPGYTAGSPWCENAPVVAPVLELGCGKGEDTAVLTAEGFHVIALDCSANAIVHAQTRAPLAQYHQQDIRDPFPHQATQLGVVVASLSLHYFDWPQTVELVYRIRHALRPGGILLCRLNSVHDHHYGASGQPEISPHYYCVDGQSKRFFDRHAMQQLFATCWHSLSMEENVIHRYEHPKAIWEAVLERAETNR